MTSRGRLMTILGLAALGLFGVIAAGMLPRLKKQRVMAAESDDESKRAPVVRVVKVELAGGNSELELPCDLMAMIESPILARVEGYISKRAVEIGARVKKGDLMVELETPEVDQQIRQAQAALSQSKAALKQMEAQIAEVKAELNLAKLTAERWKKLNSEGVISIQDADEKQSQYDVKIASLDAARATAASSEEAVRASEANLSRLQELKSFSRMTAPFDGIVTYRNPDVGTLISAGASGKEIFRVADISTIRAFVSIPQSYVPVITPGLPAMLHVDDIPAREWQAPVSNIAYALDPTSRTMLAVIKVRNPDYALKPGMYSRVKFALPARAKSMMLPGDAIIGRSDGSYVALVNEIGKVHYQKVIVGRDLGSKVVVMSGVAENDQVILSPSDDVREGVKVEARVNPAAATKQ